MLRSFCLMGLLLLSLALNAGDAPIQIPPPPPPLATPVPGVALGANTNLQKIKLPANARVMVIPVNDTESTKYGMIDHWQAGFIRRRFDQAKAEQVSLVILEIDTHGGMVDACEEINHIISNHGIPTIAFINGNAFSGGALISLGCTAIVMTQDSIIGGAQGVSIAGDLDPDMRSKLRSFLDKMVQALAEKNGYPASLVRGMVHREIEIVETSDPKNRFVVTDELPPGAPKPNAIKTWKKSGDILTLTAQDALLTNVASATCPDKTALMALLGAPTAQLATANITATEKFARTFVHPLWWIGLVVVGVIGLIWEIKAPGHGVGYAVFGICIATVFWLAFFADTAGMWEIVLFGIGMMLLAIEFFWIPGFGFTGFAGIACVLLALLLAFIPQGVQISNLWGGGSDPFQQVTFNAALSWATIALLAVLVGVGAMIWYAARMPGMRRMALTTSIGGPTISVPAGDGSIHPGGSVTTVAQTGSAIVPNIAAPSNTQFIQLIGKTGTAETVLKPAGKVRIEGATYDASCGSGWTDPGAPIVVVSVQASILHVKKA